MNPCWVVVHYQIGLRKKRCIFAVDTFDDNLCIWRCLAIYTRLDMNRGTERLTKEALKLAREYYDDNKLKRRGVRATKLVDFEGIARHHDINIGLYEPKLNSQTVWQLVYGKNQYRQGLDTINIGLYQGHCFLHQKYGCVVSEMGMYSL